MKQKFKTLLLAVLAVLMAFSVTACSAQSEETNSLVEEVDLDMLNTYSSSLIQAFAGMSKEELELQAKLYALDGQDNVAASFSNYEQQVDALGAFQEIISSTSEKTKDGYITYITAQYENKVLNAEIGYDADLPYMLMISQNAYLDCLTDTTFTPETTLSENVFSGLANLVVGMGTVFVVLIFISWVISLLKHVNKFDPSAKKAAASQPAPAPALVAAEPEEDLTEDDALVAVIAAAIAAYEGEASASLDNGIVIRSIRRHPASTWRK